MKKLLLPAFLISLAGNLVVLAVNWLHFREYDHLLWAWRMYGGEITIELSFGLRAVTIYGMAADDVTTHSLHFSPVGTVVFLLLGMAAALVLLLLFRLVRGKHS